ncbi:SsgA family sporulation/cell division regulator [Streptomyces venezuelae]|uniref:SsgA family sporulation/cell division regulator n=1 Tax=Streptomyces venezuelae TaxID=54571 RepID=UPI003323B269
MSALLPMQLDSMTGRVPLLARFSYDSADPYAIRVTFFDGLRITARWDFDRQMLAEGLHRPVGEGEVYFCPHRGLVTDELRLFLRNTRGGQEGHATLFVGARPMQRFLDQTYDVTEAGEEFLDLDGFLEELLAG